MKEVDSLRCNITLIGEIYLAKLFNPAFLMTIAMPNVQKV